MSVKEIVELSNNVELLNKRLQEFAHELSIWKIEIEAELDQLSHDVKIKAIKPFGGGGVIKTIPKGTALYYGDSQETLVNDIADELLGVLIKDNLKSNLRIALSRAINNLSTLEKKK